MSLCLEKNYNSKQKEKKNIRLDELEQCLFRFSADLVLFYFFNCIS